MKEIRIILIILTLGILSSGCVKEDAVPDLPPQKSMVMEFDDMWKTSPVPGAVSSGTPQSNFLFSASTVYLWNAILTVQMVVPVAAYLESFNHDPIWDKTELSWVWSYTMDLPQGNFTAELFAKTETSEIQWSMYISKTDGFTDFLWFTGISDLDNKSGSWIIHKDPDGDIKETDTSVPFIEILWDVNENGESSISYTSIEPGSLNMGSYIKYGKTTDPDLDVFYDIFTVWADNLINIKWNSELHYGRVLSMADYNDPYWHCWDELFKNIVCE